MKKESFLEIIDFQKVYTQYDIADLFNIKHSSRIGTSLKDYNSFKIPNPSGQGAALKAYYGKSLKEAIYYGEFDWAIDRGSYSIPLPPESDFIPDRAPSKSVRQTLHRFFKDEMKDPNYTVKRASIPNKTCKNVFKALVASGDRFINQHSIAKQFNLQPDGVRCCISRLKKEVGVPVVNKRGYGWKIAHTRQDWLDYLNSNIGRISDINFLNTVVAEIWDKEESIKVA